MEKDRKHGAFAVKKRDVLLGVALSTILSVGVKGTPSDGHEVYKYNPIPQEDFSLLNINDFPDRLSPVPEVEADLNDTWDELNRDNGPGKEPIVISLPSPSSKPEPTPTSKSQPSVRVSSSGWKLDPEISWYGPGFYGRRTACGLALTKDLKGVANRTLPCGTLVTFKWNGETLTVPVVDRGPYVKGRIFDLTGGACMAFATEQHPKGHCFTGPIYYKIGK